MPNKESEYRGRGDKKCIRNDDIKVYLKIKKPNRFHLLFYYTSYMLNMFRALLCPSSGACDCNVDYHIGRFVLGLQYVGS